MKLCRFTLTPVAPWSGWLRSDTLYGLVCRLVAEMEGETECAELIEAFRANRAPFLLSSAMPRGFLPMPCLPAPSRRRFRDIAAKYGGNAEESLFNILCEFKKFRKQAWLPIRCWQENSRSLSLEALFLSMQDEKEAGSVHSKIAIEPHVAIDRVTGSAGEGQLFFMRRRYFSPDMRFHLYARSSDPQKLLGYLRLIGEQGFGQNASTGNGQFEVEPDSDFRPETFEVEDNNAQMLCSVCSAPDMIRLGGFYKFEVKRGKTGPGYANPFKKPFLMLQEGAVLYSLPAGPFVLQNLNADMRVAQILTPLALPCRLKNLEIPPK